MSWEGWLAAAVVVGTFLTLARGLLPADLTVWTALAVLVAAHALSGSPSLPDAERAVAGLGNPGLVTIGLLFIVVEGLTRTGATDSLGAPLLRLARARTGAVIPLLVVVGACSAFLNNTAIVAMFLPIVHDLSKRGGIPSSRLYLPMCYAATLGGVCTLMGTSTNLVVDGLMRRAGVAPLGLFELAGVGLPLFVAGIAYMAVGSRFLLPDRRRPVSADDDPREYSVEMRVEEDGPLVGKTVAEAGLRHLPGLFLIEIQRSSRVFAAVGSDFVLEARDRLVFVGVAESVVDLRRVRGLVPAEDHTFRLDERPGRCLIEAVVAPQCPLVGVTIRAGDFRSVYEAAVIALARDGRRVSGRLGDVVLQPGDTLLMETRDEFPERHRHSRHFFLTSRVDRSDLPRRGRAWAALAILAALVGLVASGHVALTTGALVAAVAVVLLRCCTAAEARGSVDWGVLLTIGGALGLAGALESTGAARAAAEGLTRLGGAAPLGALAAVYLATLVCTECITNNAAAALMFPIALDCAQRLGVSAHPFCVAVMVAASCGFATPFGYQTNMMVAGPGGYRFGDYLRFGGPLDLLSMAVAVGVIPRLWPF